MIIQTTRCKKLLFVHFFLFYFPSPECSIEFNETPQPLNLSSIIFNDSVFSLLICETKWWEMSLEDRYQLMVHLQKSKIQLHISLNPKPVV